VVVEHNEISFVPYVLRMRRPGRTHLPYRTSLVIIFYLKRRSFDMIDLII